MLIESPAIDMKQEVRQRAEEALFGGVQTKPAPDMDAGPFEPSAVALHSPRRILEALAPVAPVEVIFEEPRRGRKPGSKNKPKTDHSVNVAPAPKWPRGRPPRNPEGQVRTVAPTPELELAALKSIAQTRFNPPISPIPGGRMTHPIPMFEPPPKRKRGRPRKIRPPKFDWTVWTSEETPEPVPAAPVVTAAPVYIDEVDEAPVLPNLPALARFESAGPRLRAGERWKRRIRVPGGGPARPRSQNG